jgi:hypothetical protein
MDGTPSSGVAMRMVPLFLALLLVAGLTFLVFGMRPSSPPRHRPEVDPDRREADAEVLARVKRIAWDHRELDEPLADELIRFLNARERNLDLRAVRNEVAEIAWRHREDCPALSEIVLAALRD